MLEPLLVRAYLRAGAAIPGPGGDGGAEFGPHAGGALHLFATGIAERVVKADIASLYPSLMGAYRIGPASDRLGALLHIVERLLTLRLQHKAAAREAQRGAAGNQAFDWALEFDQTTGGYIQQGNLDALQNFQKLGQMAQMAHPTHEHYLPLLYAAAAVDAGEQPHFFNTSFQLGSISMRSVVWG